MGKKKVDKKLRKKVENEIHKKRIVVPVDNDGVKKSGTVLESYVIKSDKSTNINVRIKKECTRITYNLEVPEINPATAPLCRRHRPRAERVPVLS